MTYSYMAKAVELRKYLCTDCDFPATSNHRLEAHYETRSHKNQVAFNNGTLKALPVKTAAYLRTLAMEKASSDKRKAEGRFPCNPCSKQFPSPSALRRHQGKACHIKAQALYDASNEQTETANVLSGPSKPNPVTAPTTVTNLSINPKTLSSRASRMKTLASGKHLCPYCNYAADCEGRLEYYEESQAHKKAVAMYNANALKNTEASDGGQLHNRGWRREDRIITDDDDEDYTPKTANDVTTPKNVSNNSKTVSPRASVNNAIALNIATGPTDVLKSTAAKRKVEVDLTLSDSEDDLPTEADADNGTKIVRDSRSIGTAKFPAILFPEISRNLSISNLSWECQKHLAMR